MIKDQTDQMRGLSLASCLTAEPSKLFRVIVSYIQFVNEASQDSSSVCTALQPFAVS